MVRKAFVRQFKKYFNLGKDPERQTENYENILRKSRWNLYKDIRYNTLGYKFSEVCYICSFLFGARYLYQAGGSGVDTWSDG